LKKALALFFLVIFLFNSLGYFIAFRLNQLDIHNQMRSEILGKTPDSKLIQIYETPQNKSEIAWLEDREFSYKGGLYDVVRSEKNTNGSTIYFCLNDAKEEELFSQLGENITNQLDANKMTNGKTSQLLLKLLAFDYCSETHQLVFHFTSSTITPSAFIPAQRNIDSEITTPPPRIA
jgi:hypothetical protein